MSTDSRLGSVTGILSHLRLGLRLLSLVLPIGLLLSDAAAADSRAVNTEPTRPTTYRNWMRWLPDATRLSVLSVPGTHDAMALHGGPIAETQSMPLLEQLRSGIRYLDIRARHVNDRFVMTHGLQPRLHHHHHLSRQRHSPAPGGGV